MILFNTLKKEKNTYLKLKIHGGIRGPNDFVGELSTELRLTNKFLISINGIIC